MGHWSETQVSSKAIHHLQAHHPDHQEKADFIVVGLAAAQAVEAEAEDGKDKLYLIYS